MNKIKKYAEHIADELCGAKEYAEKALEYKAMDDAVRYQAYREMANDELRHAMKVHEFATQDVEKLRAVFPEIPHEMMDSWENSHKDYVEKAAWIKQMLSM